MLFGQKKTFPQNRRLLMKMLFLFSEHNSWLNAVFARNIFWFTTTRKTILFVFFELLFFMFFHCVLFSPTSEKQRVHVLYRKNIWHPNTLLKIVSYAYTLFVILKLNIPPKNSKIGEPNKRKSRTKFRRNVGPNFDSKKPHFGPNFELITNNNVMWWCVLLVKK